MLNQLKSVGSGCHNLRRSRTMMDTGNRKQGIQFNLARILAGKPAPRPAGPTSRACPMAQKPHGGRLSVGELRRWSALALVGAGLFLAASSARAQLSSAAVNGTVRDATGAVIEGAKIGLRETSTGAQRSTTSNSAGDYAFIDVAPGTYTLEV